jgi:ATP synthase protein I
LPAVSKGGASSDGHTLAAHPFATQPEANATIVVNDSDNVPKGEDPKLDSLEDRIAAARRAEDERMAKEHAPLRRGTGAAIQIASTMVGYPLGGILIGLVLDKVFDTLPWITIALMFLAFAGACLHVVQLNKNRVD